MWKLIKDKKPPMYISVILSDGAMELEGFMGKDGAFMKNFAEYDLSIMGFHPKAWCEMPKWEGEK